MRHPKYAKHPTIVWTIAGSDSGGGAGIQADLKTFHRFGVHGCSVITAVTAQNSTAVCRADCMSAASIHAQLSALKQDLPASVIKLGMQGEIAPVREFLKNYTGIVIFDPVITATSGGILNDNLADLRTLIPYADLITPNIPEAEMLTGLSIHDTCDRVRAAQHLLELGASRVLLKGGHGAEGSFKHDYYTDGRQAFWLGAPSVHTVHTHGSGCTLAAAVAANIALEYDWLDAVVIARMYVQQGIRLATQIGQGPGAVIQGSFPEASEDLPWVSAEPLNTLPEAFQPLQSTLGLYPIIDSSAWIVPLLKGGVRSMQLRIKEGDKEKEIKEAVQISRAASVPIQLFINDHWSLAIQYGAYGVHLGQEDLAHADLGAIRAAGLRLGVSTHCFYEVARAQALRPSYIACGPIFDTMSKPMAFVPQGVERLAYWCRVLRIPVVAIGGITVERAAAVAKTGVQGIAVLSAITQAPNLTERLKAFQAMGLTLHESL